MELVVRCILSVIKPACVRSFAALRMTHLGSFSKQLLTMEVFDNFGKETPAMCATLCHDVPPQWFPPAQLIEMQPRYYAARVPFRRSEQRAHHGQRRG